MNIAQTARKSEKKVVLVQESLMALAGKGNYGLLRSYAKSMVNEIEHKPEEYLHLFQEAKRADEITEEAAKHSKEAFDRTVTTHDDMLNTCFEDKLESDDEDFNDKEDFDSERFEDYTWEVECTESVENIS